MTFDGPTNRVSKLYISKNYRMIVNSNKQIIKLLRPAAPKVSLRLTLLETVPSFVGT